MFFIRSIAKVSGNFFVIYSGETLYKLKRKQTSPTILFGDPLKEGHSLVKGLPNWRGTAIGIDINVDETSEFSSLLNIIRRSYSIDVKSRKKAFFKKIRFT